MPLEDRIINLAIMSNFHFVGFYFEKWKMLWYSMAKTQARNIYSIKRLSIGWQFPFVKRVYYFYEEPIGTQIMETGGNLILVAVVVVFTAAVIIGLLLLLTDKIWPSE